MAESSGQPWPVRDIVFVSIIGPLMLAAFVEWILFLIAFLYCLAKVYQKAEHWSIKVLAVIMMILFALFRGIFLPIMIVTLPLPRGITQYYPLRLVSFLQWFAFWSFSALLMIPWLFCIYGQVTHSVGRQKRIQQVLDDRTAPKAVVVMPVYKEDPDVLVKAIDSIVDSDYPRNCIHVFLSYDGVAIDEPYLRILHHLGIPITLETYPQSIDVIYKGARITVSRFEHGGKRHCQKKTFQLIDKVYTNYLRYNDDLFMLFIDSDCILDKFCLQNFMYDMELKPGSKHNMLAMTGVITSTTERNSLLTVLQDVEYLHGQLFERSVESGCGAVTCLPGALTMLRFSAFRKMAKYYFADNIEHCEDLFDYAKCHLGEDRMLTHLFMIGARQAYQIQMCSSAFCKTEAVQTFRSLLKQRRRWFLGYITNEVCMLTDIRLWMRYPLLCLMRFMQNTIRTTALLFTIQIISIMTTSSKIKDLPVGFIAISLGLNYLLMFYFGLKLKRFKAWLYPLVFVINPFFNWLYMVYGIFTAGQRTWGGPRADAAKTDGRDTSGETVEHSVHKGDGPQYTKVPTSREDVERRGVPIHPAEKLNRRLAFVSPPYNSSSGTTLSRTPAGCSRASFHHDDSLELQSRYEPGTEEISLAQNVEDLMNDVDRAKLYLARQMQEPANLMRTTHAEYMQEMYVQNETQSQTYSVDRNGHRSATQQLRSLLPATALHDTTNDPGLSLQNQSLRCPPDTSADNPREFQRSRRKRLRIPRRQSKSSGKVEDMV